MFYKRIFIFLSNVQANIKVWIAREIYLLFKDPHHHLRLKLAT